MNRNSLLMLLLCVSSIFASCEREFEVSCFDMSHVHAVDLGLSVDWACCNVGASAPEDVGDYFAWGETVSKKLYYLNNYKYVNYNTSLVTKYCTDPRYGKVDNLVLLTEDDDVAYVQWGDGWRMPTYEEIRELSRRCTWRRGTYNGVDGYMVEGPNDNAIFFPCSGSLYGKELENMDKACCWSSGVAGMNSTAYCLFFEYAWENEDRNMERSEVIANLNRYLGLPVRAVRNR